MISNYSGNNIIKIGGIVDSNARLSHEVYGEKFYIFDVNVSRLSGADDKIPVIVSERLLSVDKIVPGLIVDIEGQFRSYNQFNQEKNKLMLSIFVKDLKIVETEDEVKAKNNVTLNGFVCKKPIYRRTPLGREIADVLLAVNRAYNKSDYIPCIMWGRNAKFCEELPVGSNLKLEGRVQSRIYEKKIDEETTITHIAYEVSVAKLQLAETKEV